MFGAIAVTIRAKQDQFFRSQGDIWQLHQSSWSAVREVLSDGGCESGKSFGMSFDYYVGAEDGKMGELVEQSR